MNKPTELTFHSDNEHGWYEVQRAELNFLNIPDKISGYSYQDDGGKVYLEEDCDIGIYMAAWRFSPATAREDIKWTNKHIDGQSWIRDLKPYQAV